MLLLFVLAAPPKHGKHTWKNHNWADDVAPDEPAIMQPSAVAIPPKAGRPVPPAG